MTLNSCFEIRSKQHFSENDQDSFLTQNPIPFLFSQFRLKRVILITHTIDQEHRFKNNQITYFSERWTED